MKPVALAAIGAGFALVLAGAWTGVISSYYTGLLTEALITALFAMSLDLMIGLLGLNSLGHAAYFGFGAYVSGMLSLHGEGNAFVLLAAAAVGAGLLGAVFSAVALRAIGPYFLIITLALGYLPWTLAIRWRAVTGGDDGLPGILRPELAPGLPLDGDAQYLTFVAAVFLVCAVLMAVFMRSALGHSLRGIKDSPSRMAALGYDIWRLKYLCSIVAAVFAGIAGALLGFYNGFVSPDNLSVYRSVEAMVAVILGGPGTLIGPALAAALILVVRVGVGAFTEHWGMALGVLYIAVVLFAPRGLYFATSDFIAGRRRAA